MMMGVLFTQGRRGVDGRDENSRKTRCSCYCGRRRYSTYYAQSYYASAYCTLPKLPRDNSPRFAHTTTIFLAFSPRPLPSAKLIRETHDTDFSKPNRPSYGVSRKLW